MSAPWAHLDDENILRMRIRDLDLKLEESDVFPWITRVLDELKMKGLHFRPRIYFGDEWFSPEGVAAVGVPFFLAHPRLRNLEKKLMFECEGDSEEEFCRLLRHELGHAFDHAFKLSRRKMWMKIFGDPKADYHPESYRPRPYSKNYVRNLGRWYAQAHPDEDFAETFAAWLNPHSNWRETYRTWGAYKKLLYVDDLAREFSHRTVPEPKGRMIADARFLTTTLKNHYKKKISEYAEEYPDFYDRDLLRIFAVKDAQTKLAPKAVQFMRRNRKEIIASLSHWTGERVVTIEGLVSRLTERCRQLDLRLIKSETATALELSGLLATLVSNYLFTGHFRRKI